MSAPQSPASPSLPSPPFLGHAFLGHAFLTMNDGTRIPLGPEFCPAHVRLGDIVRSLSKHNRYLGHTTLPYTVAEHCMFVCRLAEHRFGSGTAEARLALAHDFAEAYTSDFPKDFKRLIPGIREFEDRIERVVAARFGLLPPPLPPGVKELDDIAAHVEARALFQTPPAWATPVGPDLAALFWKPAVRNAQPWVFIEKDLFHYCKQYDLG